MAIFGTKFAELYTAALATWINFNKQRQGTWMHKKGDVLDKRQCTFGTLGMTLGTPVQPVPCRENYPTNEAVSCPTQEILTYRRKAE